MEENTDVQALEKISSEVDESQIKVILSSQCIKAQQFLLTKLKTQSERYKETCSFISSANLKVETEIKQAEQEIRSFDLVAPLMITRSFNRLNLRLKLAQPGRNAMQSTSMLIAQDTIKSGNVDLKKEWLLAKVRKADIIERVSEGKQKYEALWIECKNRYESIPFVQKLIDATDKQKKTENDINDLDNQATKLNDDIETKLEICTDLNQKRAIELANFIVNERPKLVLMIKDKNETINNLTQEIELLLKERNKDVLNAEVIESLNKDDKNINEQMDKDEVPNLSKIEDDLLIPKLNLNNFDLDIIDVKLDQVKMKKDEILNTVPKRTTNITRNTARNAKHHKAYEYNIISPFFYSYKEVNTRDFSNRKLINILEDININSGEVYNIIQKVNPEQLKPVCEISVEKVLNVNMTECFTEDKDATLIERKSIEINDVPASSNTENIIIPPTQFLDITLSDEATRKRVSFDLPTMEITEIMDADKEDDVEINEPENQTIISQLDASAVSDESFTKIKEMLLKQHNLDLSPQFIYAKNNVLQKKSDDNVVTSIFFQKDNDTNTEQIDNEMNVDEQEVKTKETKEKEEISKSEKGLEEELLQKDPKENTLVPMDVDAFVSAPQLNKAEKPIKGFLFTHGAQEIPDSLNVSQSTLGYEESDFPHCIDSSILLSPKTDVAHEDNPDGISQEIPNFLSGFRKTGLSFFGGPSTSTEPKSDSSAQEHGNNNFSFNFGGEKKNRGSLFSLFR